MRKKRERRDKKEREREGERDRERERKRDRQTDTNIHKQRGRQRWGRGGGMVGGRQREDEAFPLNLIGFHFGGNVSVLTYCKEKLQKTIQDWHHISKRLNLDKIKFI